jgi:hypothetical protein
MSLSASSAGQNIDTKLPLSSVTAVNAPPPAQTSRATHTPDQTPGETPEAKGDKDLALVFAKALRDLVKTGPSFDGTDKIDNIPPDSTFGQWWTHLHKLLKNPQFVDWARHKHIDLSKPLSISALGHLSATASGQRQTFRAADKDPLWDMVVAPLLRAAGVVAAGKNPLVVTPGPPSSASFEVVANFYGEEGNVSAARANELEQTQAFRKNAANDPGSQVSAAVRLDKLDSEKTALGDLEDIHRLSGKLTQLLRNGSRQIEDALKSTTMDVDPNSSYGQQQQVGNTAPPTLEQFILANNWVLPKTIEELDNLRDVINAPPLPVALRGNMGGALSWPVPLDQHVQKTIYSHFRYNLSLPALINDGTSRPDPKGALGYLTRNMQFSASELRNPLPVIEKILDTPDTRELESALKEKMGPQWQTSSPYDWVLAAIATTLDQESLYRPKPNHVAGYNLADGRFNGKSLGTIKQGLVDHLIKLKRVTVELAPIAAHLLLARAAPELLVKNIPNDVTYGSTAWVTFKAAVARIETYSPGATAQMTFAQVSEQDAKDPISSTGQAIQDATSRLALIEWGKLHGTLSPREDGNYPQTQIEQTQQAFQDKTTTLRTTFEHLAAKVPTQRDVALAELKEKFGAELPYELHCFRDNSPVGRGSGNLASATQPSFSLLDFYLTNPQLNEFSNWVSDDSRFPTRMIAQLSSLPNPKAKHKEAFDRYKNQVTDAHATVIKNQLSRLPMKDRENLEFGKVRVFIEGEVIKSETVLPSGTHKHEDSVPSQPQDKRALIFQTERDGHIEFYEMSSQKGQITKRDDLKENFKEGLQGDWIKTPRTIGEAWKNTAIYEKQTTVEQVAKQAASPLPVTTPASFTSPRSHYIGELVAAHSSPASGFDHLFELTQATTTFDDEKAKQDAIFNIVLGRIPGGSAVRHLINGDPLAAFNDLLFDGTTYLTGLAFSKGAGAARGAARSRVAGAASRPFGRGVLGKSPSMPGGNAPMLAGAKFPHARQLQQSGMNNAQLNQFAKRADIAEGTYQVGATTERVKATAILDEKTDDWFHYDAAKGRAYGTKIDNFTPQTHRPVSTAAAASSAPLNNFEKSLASDNVIRLGGKMQDLKLIANEMHTYVDKYKGAKRLNIVAHGHARDFIDKLLSRGTQVVIDGKSYSAKELVVLLNSKGVDPSAYNNIRLLVCHSGEGGSGSFGRLLQQETQRPVKAFEGTVTVDYGSTYMTNTRNTLAKDFQANIRGITPQAAEILANNQMKADFIKKIEPKVKKSHGSTIKINVARIGEPPRMVDSVITYKPVHFH